MNSIRLIVALAQWFVVLAAFAAAPADDPLGRPATLGPRAASVMSTAVTRAGDRLVAVGDRGVILLSDDSGRTWRQAATPVSVLLTGVRFANARVGWAVGHSGVVLKTQDGGQSWALQLDGVRAAAVVSETAASLQVDPAMSKRLTDDAQRLVHEGADKPWMDVDVVDEQHLTVIGAFGLALHSDDGGLHWRSVGHELPNPQGAHLYGIAHQGGTVVVAGEQGLLLQSSDAGHAFTTVNTGSKTSNFGLLLLSEHEWLLYGLRGTAFVCSVDSGCVGSRTAETASLTGGLRCVDGTIVLTSQAGTLLVSTDGGHTFTVRTPSQPVPAIGLAESPDGSLVVAGVRGIQRIERNVLRPRS